MLAVEQLTPTAVSGSLTIAVGRVRKSILGDDVLSVFTVGDQLLWGAAEPVRRAFRLVLEHVKLSRVATQAGAPTLA